MGSCFRGPGTGRKNTRPQISAGGKYIGNNGGYGRKGSTKNYFGSKEGLVKDTVITLLESALEAKKELWESDLPFPELMKRAVSMQDDFIDYVNPEFLRALFDTDPEIKKLTDDFYKHRYPYIVGQFIEKGRREGYIIRKELSIEAESV